MEHYEILPVRRSELAQVLDIYAQAREFMRSTGNPGQWGKNYPPEALVVRDLDQGLLYALREGPILHAVFRFEIAPDPTYAVIEGGRWRSDAPYGTIHRVASDGRIHEVLPQIVDFCAAGIPHLRIDTHRDNQIMQRQIRKCGFRYCGIIRLANGGPRLAYERMPEG